MGSCEFPHLVALAFREPLPSMQLGFAALETNESPSMKIFREIVMECVSALDNRNVRTPLPVSARQQITMMTRRQAS
jgi:hypothetical protein